MEGEKFPATREEPITIADANELELSDVRYAINEMFARHGANFKDAKTKKTFSAFSWYQPRADVTFDAIETEFSDVEKQNLAVLRRCREAKVAAARREARPIRGEPVDDESAGARAVRQGERPTHTGRMVRAALDRTPRRAHAAEENHARGQ